jgi:hypothetical protein
MRKVTYSAVEAFMSHTALTISNTHVKPCDDEACTRMFLFGNLIAKHTYSGRVMVRDAGWQSNTTKERLNGLGAGIYQKAGAWYIKGVPFDELTDGEGWYTL